jgi:hypothetical protein
MRSHNRFLFSALLCGISALAFATGTHQAPPAKPSAPAATSESKSVADSKSTSKANSAAKAQSSSLAQSNNSNDNSNHSANSNANDSSAVVSSEFEDRLQAPAVSAPPVYASGPCAYGWSAGLAVPGGGLSGGKSKPDVSCDRRELVRVLTPLNPWLALKVACEDPLIVDMRLRNLASAEDCKYVPPAAAKVDKTISPQNNLQIVTKEEAQSMVDKAFKQSTKK